MGKSRKRSRTKTCYMCDEPATSREHCPPACFFLDVNSASDGRDLSKNLLTVPSCDMHNTERSHDDQYLLSIITAMIEVNDYGREVYEKRIRPYIRERPWLVRTFYQRLFPILIRNRVTGAFSVDFPRFAGTIEKIARAIYFKHFRQRSPPKYQVVSASLIASSGRDRESINHFLRTWRANSDNLAARLQKLGANPEIFFYQVIDFPQPRADWIRLVFYEGVIVDVIFFWSAQRDE